MKEVFLLSLNSYFLKFNAWVLLKNLVFTTLYISSITNEKINVDNILCPKKGMAKV